MEPDPRPTPDVLSFRPISESDFERAVELDAQYLGSGREKLGEWRAARPEWLRGAYLADELVGICYGTERASGLLILQGIAVMAEHWRKGIGSRLIQDFEDTVFSDGISRISLASAGDLPTESFYLKNGYTANQIMLRVRRDVPVTGDGESMLTPDKTVDDEEGRRMYFRTDEYARGVRDKLKEVYDAEEALFIFGKEAQDDVLRHFS